MTVSASLDIKFRAFGITFGHWSWSVSEPIPAEVALLAGAVDFVKRLASKLQYDAHGVKLAVVVVA